VDDVATVYEGGNDRQPGKAGVAEAEREVKVFDAAVKNNEGQHAHRQRGRDADSHALGEDDDKDHCGDRMADDSNGKGVRRGDKEEKIKKKLRPEETALEVSKALRDLTGTLIGHVSELRSTLLPQLRDASESFDKLKRAVSTTVDLDELREKAADTAKLLREMLWEARQEREAERDQLRQITSLVAATLTELSDTDEKLAGQANKKLTALERISNAEDMGGARSVLADALSGLRNAFRVHTMERARQQKRMQAAVTTLQSELVEAKKEGRTDALTGLWNRGAFDREIERRIARVTAGLDSCGLMIVDIDYFKRVNDTFGHQAGDIVIKHVAEKLLRSCFRAQDFVARYGGEEFAIFVSGLTAGNLRAVAERIRIAVEKSEVDTGKNLLNVNISLGATMGRENDSPKTWLSRADAALYEAKESGRNRVITA